MAISSGRGEIAMKIPLSHPWARSILDQSTPYPQDEWPTEVMDFEGHRCVMKLIAVDDINYTVGGTRFMNMKFVAYPVGPVSE